MFTDLSAHCCIDRGRRRKPSFRLRRRPPRSGTSGMCKRRQEAPRASSIRWCDDPHGALREGQTAPKVPSNKGLHLPSAPDTIREFQYSRLSENALLSVGSCLRSAFRTVILKPTVPGRAKHSSLRQLAVSSNSRAEPDFGNQQQRRHHRQGHYKSDLHLARRTGTPKVHKNQHHKTCEAAA